MIRKFGKSLLLAVVAAMSLVSTPAVLAAAAGEDVVWIDVRSPREYRKGHIEGAVNIPHGDIGHKVFQEVSNTFVEVHIYDDNLGTFAGLALELLMEMGFQEVINEGGYEQLLQKQKAAQQP